MEKVLSCSISQDFFIWGRGLTSDLSVGSRDRAVIDAEGTGMDSIHLTGPYATAQLSRYRYWDSGLGFRLLIYDGNSWFLSDKEFDMESDDGGSRNFLDISSSSWSIVAERVELNDFLITNNELPDLTLISGGSPNITNIIGMGLYLQGNPNSAYRITFNSLTLYEEFHPAVVDCSVVKNPLC